MKDIFWDIWEFICSEYPDIADEYCVDDDTMYYHFRNEIQCKSDIEIHELIVEILKKIRIKLTNDTIKSSC